MGKQNGLTDKEAKKRLFEYGENKLAPGKKISALKMFGGQFKDLMIMILLASTFISAMMGETVEAIAIVVIVLMNAILGFAQEFRTERTLEALKNMAAPTANALRDGRTVTIPAAEIVPGDVILVKAGDKIPADARLTEVVSLACDEALLTGESLPVDKAAASSDETPLGIGKPDLIYMGTVVTKGRGMAEVVATGMSTEMGKIAGMLHEIEEEATPLQKKLALLGKYIAAGCLGICVIVALTGVLRGYPVFDMFITGISLAVAAVPEGLPAIVTIALALAVNRILKRNALVRKLHAVETLGCANVICTDKTGTLTENKMTVKRIFTLDFNLDVSGNGYEQAGEFSVGGRRAVVGASAAVSKLLDIAVVCNNSEITAPAETQAQRDRTRNVSREAWEVNGDPTEIALLIMSAKANIYKASRQYDVFDEIPFDSDRKRMTVLVRDKSGRSAAFSKGAPDILLKHCKYILTDHGVQPLTPAIHSRITKANEDMAQEAMRVLGFAYKEAPPSGSESEKDMVFVGLAGMIDPPRPEVYNAVAHCRQAKIRTVMITGDHRETARAIAADIGIYRNGDVILTGAELDSMGAEGLDNIIGKVSVFARVNPEHKLQIVRALKKRGNIVAMTGDGVNDAPAVKEADIGVAMGISGTDVTKNASSIVLLDDNFATLVATVGEGRAVYANIRKFIRYLLSCNIGEVVTMFISMLMGLPVVLLPIQILLVNLATDGLPALALGLEPADPDIMSRKPRPAGESIFSNGLGGKIVFRGMLIGLTTLGVFTFFIRWYGDIDTARTAALLTLVLTQLVHVFECKSESRSIFAVNPLNNPFLIGAVLISGGVMALMIYHPWMQTVFSTVPLSAEQVLRVFIIALIVPVVSAVTMILPKRIKKDAVIPAGQTDAQTDAASL